MKRRIVNVCSERGSFLVFAIWVLPFATRAQPCADSPVDEILLYFPTATDASFPNWAAHPPAIWGSTGVTSPAEPFDVDQLVPGTSEPAMIDEIASQVREDFAEFSVEVNVTRAPYVAPMLDERRRTVAIGSDRRVVWNPAGNRFKICVGQAASFLGNGLVRIWADSLDPAFSVLGNTLCSPPSFSFVDFANAIGSYVSHEVGHTYLLDHCDARSRPGEAPETSHLMSDFGSDTCSIGSPTVSLPCSTLRGTNRHFGDTAYSALASSIGLRVNSLHAWDLENPNPEAACEFHVDVSTPSSSLTVLWNDLGALAPWGAPSVTSLGMSGGEYRYRITWDAPKPWSGGADGVVPSGGTFHVGLAIAETRVSVRGTLLRGTIGASKVDLALSPRVPLYDSPVLTASMPCLFEFNWVNPSPMPLELHDVRVAFIPRLLDIESMNAEEIATPRSRSGLSIEPFRVEQAEPIVLPAKSSSRLVIASLTDERDVDLPADPPDPDVDPDAPLSVSGFRPRRILSLFPSTVVYVTARVVDTVGDGVVRRAHTSSRIYHAFTGFVPDCDCSGVDDAVEIASGALTDADGNGMPDECERQFIRGDATHDGIVNMSDPILVFSFLFLGGVFPNCLDAFDGADQGVINISSGVYVLNNLFLGGPAPPAPFPACGTDTTDDDLGCLNLTCP